MNEKKPLISIFVPVYCVEEWLDRCISSIVSQTYTNLQIILVDDDSPDRCPEICEKWASIDSRIQVIHKKNEGVSVARNVGLENATGDYISFVDSDDWIDASFYEILLNTLLQNDLDIIECGSRESDGTTIPREKNWNLTICDDLSAMEKHIKDEMFSVVIWNKLYRRDIINVPFKAGKYAEDLFWTYKILANCQRLGHINVRMYYHFLRNNSFTGAPYSIRRIDLVEGAYERYCFINSVYPTLVLYAKENLWGLCIYHEQMLLKHPELGKKLISINRKKLHKWMRAAKGICDKKITLSVKQKIWLLLYRFFPSLICRLRNFLNIGL